MTLMRDRDPLAAPVPIASFFARSQGAKEALKYDTSRARGGEAAPE
jgi:hypothetical protein